MTPVARAGAVLTAAAIATAAGASVPQAVADRDGAGRQRLTEHPARDRHPTWHPDGDRLAFESSRDGDWNLYVLDLAGGEPRRLTPSPANDRGPDYSPDGERLAFVSDRSGRDEIWLLNLATSDATQLTDDPTDKGVPRFDPTGTWIVFTRGTDGHGGLARVAVTGGAVESLVEGPFHSACADIAPDGRLAFHSRRDGTGEDDDIYTAAPDGAELRLLFAKRGHDFCPAVAPDGRIAFASVTPEGPRHLAVIDSEGSSLAQLAEGFRRVTMPAWSPDGHFLAYAARAEEDSDDLWLEPVPAADRGPEP